MIQRVFVTGGANGIGREIVRAFAEDGARVFTSDIDAEALDRLEKEIPGLAAMVCDVSDREVVERMIAHGIDALGGLDVLVNNVGIAGPTGPVDAVDPGEWDKVVSVNLTGTFNVTRLAIPHLKRSPAGVILTMSSVAGRLGWANRSPYCTTKWGLIGFTKTLALELGKYGIRANAILPGAVDGPRVRKVLEEKARMHGLSVEEVKEAALSGQSIKTLADPRDIAALAVFLASDSGKSISGQALSMDGDSSTSPG
jgi:NAD(P)-dependent dehydrogenase (short-subunit alcohol dehydrogenase family)